MEKQAIIKPGVTPEEKETNQQNIKSADENTALEALSSHTTKRFSDAAEKHLKS